MTTDSVLQHSQRKRFSDMRRRAVEAANSRPRLAPPPEHSNPCLHSSRLKSKFPQCALRDRPCTSPRAARPPRFVRQAPLLACRPAADSTRHARLWTLPAPVFQWRQSGEPQVGERAHLSSTEKKLRDQTEPRRSAHGPRSRRSEEHTSEL